MLALPPPNICIHSRPHRLRAGTPGRGFRSRYFQVLNITRVATSRSSIPSAASTPKFGGCPKRCEPSTHFVLPQRPRASTSLGCVRYPASCTRSTQDRTTKSNRIMYSEAFRKTVQGSMYCVRSSRVHVIRWGRLCQHAAPRAQHPLGLGCQCVTRL